jgi:hypothetical protein
MVALATVSWHTFCILSMQPWSKVAFAKAHINSAKQRAVLRGAEDRWSLAANLTRELGSARFTAKGAEVVRLNESAGFLLHRQRPRELLRNELHRQLCRLLLRRMASPDIGRSAPHIHGARHAIHDYTRIWKPLTSNMPPAFPKA